MQSLASSSISLLLKIKKRSRWTQPISVIKPNPTKPTAIANSIQPGVLNDHVLKFPHKAKLSAD